MFDLKNEIAVVTGCSGILGRQYVQVLLSQGARVVGLDRQPSELINSISADRPDRFVFVQADVTSTDSLQASLVSITERWGVPTVLINNAAIDSPPSAPLEENGPYESYPEASFDKVMEVNVKGVHLCCQVFGSAMASAEKGSIVNIASIYGVVSPDQSLYAYRRENDEDFFKPVAYAVSKSAILNLTRYLAVYWARSNVRVNTLTLAGVFANQDPRFLEAYCGRIPVGRMAQPDDYNGAIVFLASDASRYMTGANLVVDGGWTAI